jgi:putative ABC transport system permease protein
MRLAWTLAWRNLWRNKRRTAITVSSVVMAVLLATVVGSMQQGQYDQMIENSVGRFTGHLQIQGARYLEEPILDNGFPADAADLAMIAARPGVAAVVPRLETYLLLAGDSRSKAAMVLGIDPEAEAALSDPASKLITGRMFASGSDEGLLLGSSLARFLDAEVGDTLAVLGSGYQGVSASGLVTVVGIVRFGFTELDESIAYMPLGAAQVLTGMEGRLTSVPIKLDRPSDSREAAAAWAADLPDGWLALDWTVLMPELVQAIQADRGSGTIILMVLYVVVGFGIFGTVLMMTAERRFELGVMLSIGTSRSRLSAMLALEMSMITLMGTVTGILASWPVIAYFNRHPLRFSGEMAAAIEEFGMEPWIRFSLDPSIPAIQAVIVLVMTLVIASHPVRYVRRLDAVSSMRR